MEAICTAPREIESSRVARTPHPSVRGALPLFVGLFALGLSGCSIVFPPGGEDDCVSLEDVCPNLECEAGFVVNDDGCALCECAEPEPEPEPEGCFSDADCAAGEACVFGAVGPTPVEPGEPTDPTEPAPPPPDDGGDEDRACEPNPDGSCGDPQDPPGVVAPEGVCLPAGCDLIAIGCPEGTVIEWDFSTDPCGVPTCVPVDDSACELLDDEACLAREDCELVFDGGAAPCFEECDADGNCTSFCEERPEPDNRCVTRDDPPPPPPPGQCSDDSQCPVGQHCEIIDECGSMCDPSSEEPCPDVCVVIGECRDDVPPPPTGCTVADDCGAGYLCEQVEVCTCSGDSADPPEGGGAMPCQTECHFEGQCVWNPDNTTCFFDGDCGDGQRCEYFDSCVAPPDCPECLIACQGVCVDVDPPPTACMEDSECGDGQVCDTVNYCEADPTCTDPNGVGCPAVCYGRCVAPEPPSDDRCLEQADCAEGYRCATEVDSCYCPDGAQCDVCYWQCVPEDATMP